MHKMNNKNKKFFRLLSSAAIGVLIASAVTTNAHAAVTAYIVNYNGKIISFDSNKLLDDYANNFMLGVDAPMYNEYLTDSKNNQLVAFNDDKKGFVSYKTVESAYENALLNGNATGFNINAITENASDDDIVKDMTIGYEWKDGEVQAATYDVDCVY